MVKVVCDYTASQTDELPVHRGHLVQIIATNNQDMYLVQEHDGSTSSGAQGWIPAHVLSQRDAANR